MTEKHVIKDKTTHDENNTGTLSHSTVNTYICTDQFNYTSFKEAHKKEQFGSLWDFLKKKCEIEWRYNGHDKYGEDNDDDAQGTCTRSSLTISSSKSSGTGTGTDNNAPNYEKIEEIFRIKCI